MKNAHGVDTSYIEKNLSRVLRDLNSMPADELARKLLRLATTVDSDVFKEHEFAGLANTEEAVSARPAKLRFPTMLRKMWSGGEVQAWLDQQVELSGLQPAGPSPASELNAQPRPDDRAGEFQGDVYRWLVECFKQPIADDKEERAHRFLEESLELAQSCGCTAESAMQLVGYTFSRPVGEAPQEVGGVMVTLAALCTAHDLEMMRLGRTELERVCRPEVMEKVRLKQAAKPSFSALPGVYPERVQAQTLGLDEA